MDNAEPVTEETVEEEFRQTGGQNGKD